MYKIPTKTSDPCIGDLEEVDRDHIPRVSEGRMDDFHRSGCESAL
jgi:hypothetical protein